MNKLIPTLLLTLSLGSGWCAANGIDGEVVVKAGTTGNKALPSSQTTNVTISASSQVADGASAVAFSLNSSNALSTSGAKLLGLGHGGTNVDQFFPEGSILVGRNALDFWGAPAGYETLISYRDSRAGDFDGQSILLEAQSSATNYSSFTVSGDSSGFNESIQTSITAGVFRTATISVGGSSLSFSLTDGATTRLSLDPLAADGTAVSIVDSSLTHTTGNINEFNNNGTNYVTFQPDQSSTNTPITININGTLKRVHVGAVDSGGTGLRALTVTN